MKVEINIDDKLIERVKSFFTKKNVIIAFTIVFVMSIVVIKAADVDLTVFEPNTVISSSDVNTNFANLNAAVAPVGTVIAYAGKKSTIPDGWLICDGSEVDSTTYPRLFTILGTSWGNGDDGDSTTFNLPDLRGQFLRGVDDNTLADTDPDKGSRTALLTGGNSGSSTELIGSYQSDAFQTHGHYWTGYMSDCEGSGTNVMRWQGGAGNTGGLIGVPTTGSKISSESRPKNAYVYYIIRAK